MQSTLQFIFIIKFIKKNRKIDFFSKLNSSSIDLVKIIMRVSVATFFQFTWIFDFDLFLTLIIWYKPFLGGWGYRLLMDWKLFTFHPSYCNFLTVYPTTKIKGFVALMLKKKKKKKSIPYLWKVPAMHGPFPSFALCKWTFLFPVMVHYFLYSGCCVHNTE